MLAYCTTGAGPLVWTVSQLSGCTLNPYFLESSIVLVAAAAVASFAAAAFSRSNVVCVAASWVIAELLYVSYYLVRLDFSAHGPDEIHSVARGVSISVVFGAPFFLIAVTGFTFLARWIYRRIRHE